MSGNDQWDSNKVRIQIGQDLTSIAEMYVKLKSEAINRAGDPNIPGGAAMVMLGPGADVEAWGYVQLSALFGRIDTDSTEIERILKTDLEPPLSFLAGWADIVREERGGVPAPRRARIADEIRFLRASVDWMLSEQEDGSEFWLPIEDFATRLRATTRALENVLSAGERKEFSRVRCINEACDIKPRLERLRQQDRYQCPACSRPYDHAQFNKAKEQNLADRGAERFVLVTDATDASQVPKQTMHSWVNRLNVKSVCDIKTKRLMVWWPDVRDRAFERRIELARRRAS